MCFKKGVCVHVGEGKLFDTSFFVVVVIIMLKH